MWLLGKIKPSTTDDQNFAVGVEAELYDSAEALPPTNQVWDDTTTYCGQSKVTIAIDAVFNPVMLDGGTDAGKIGPRLADGFRSLFSSQSLAG